MKAHSLARFSSLLGESASEIYVLRSEETLMALSALYFARHLATACLVQGFAMTAKPTINWFDPRKRRNIDGSMLPSDTSVLLSSRHHLTPPRQYIIYKELPKPFWFIWGADLQEVTTLDALAYKDSPMTLGSRYFSEPMWNLPAPPSESGYVTFRAWTDTRDACSGSLGSARLWLEEVSSSGRAEAIVGANISGPSLNIGPK